MKIPIDDVMRVLRFAPAGMTTAQLAEQLKLDRDALGGRLSKLAAYGQIEQSFERASPGMPGQPQRWCRWRHKEAAHA